jgi:phage-related protein
MKLLLVSSSSYRVFAACSDSGRCPLLRFIEELEGPAGKDSVRMLAMLRRISLVGLPARHEVNHRVAEGIGQLRQGRIRVLHFTERDRVVICSHGFVKRAQKTPAGEVARAVEARARYRAGVASGAVEIIREEGP